jgi:CheY-like chemotaxis protein
MDKREDITIFLVEDNEVDVMGVQRAFKKSNFPNPIVVAGNGQEALSKLRDGKSVPRPYLVLLDLNMPKMNGIEFLEEIRKDNELRSAIVFVLTTSNATDDRNKTSEQNVAGYIVKGKETGGFINVVNLLNQYAQVCEIS